MIPSPRGSGPGRSEPVCQCQRPKIASLPLARLLGQFALISLVVATPWLFGGVQAAVQVWLFIAVAGALLCFLVDHVTQRAAGAVLPLAIVPLIFALGLGALQLLPLGAQASGRLSPGGAEVRAALAAESSPSAASLATHLGLPPRDDRYPLSLDPASTRHDLALLTLAVAVFLLGARFFAAKRAQFLLLSVIAVNGAALALFALIQRLTWNGLIYWKVPLTQGRGAFGPFVNENNAGGFLNLCLACAMGVTVWVIGLNGSAASTATPNRPPGRRPLLSRVGEQLRESLANLNTSTLIVLSLTGCIIAGVLCSLSRGAAVAMIAATLVTTLLVLCARGWSLRWWAIAAAALVGLFLVSWVGMRDSVCTRLATLLDRETISQHDLIGHWSDGLRAAPDFWQVGSGLGTYRYVYGLYQRHPSRWWFDHAENEYLQALVEGGIAGLGLILIMLGLVGVASWRLLRDDTEPGTFAFGIVGIFALTGQTIHAFFDFGLHIPANLMLFALVCGAVSGRAAKLAKRRSSAGWLPLLRSRYLPMGLVALLLGATVWGCEEAGTAAAVEPVLKHSRFDTTWTAVTPETLEGAIDWLAAALECRKDDADGHQRMAELWIHLYRVRALEELCDETTSAAERADLWQRTAPVVLHGQAHHLAEYNLFSDLERLRSDPLVADHLRPALRHLILARRSCPLLPLVHLRLTELCVLAGDPADDEIHLQRFRRLVPGNPGGLLRCGVLELQAGRVDLACESWRRGLTLSPRYVDGVLNLAGRELSLWHTVEKALPDSPALLIELARERYQGEEHATMRGMLIERAERLIDGVDLPEEERHHLRGSVLALKEHYPEAIEHYSRAVELRSEAVSWRYELAVALQQQGLLDEAHKQARWCARMEPHHREYRELLEQILEAQLRKVRTTR